MKTLLETERLIIAVPHPSDLDKLLELQGDPDVMRLMGNGVPRNREEVIAGLTKALNHQAKYNFSLGLVYEKHSQACVGRAGVVHLDYDDTNPEIEVGYMLAKDAWGKGYATELTKALIKYCFEHLKLVKVVAVADPRNTNSKKVLLKSGMVYVKNSHYWGKEVEYFEIVM